MYSWYKIMNILVYCYLLLYYGIICIQYFVDWTYRVVPSTTVVTQWSDHSLMQLITDKFIDMSIHIPKWI